MTTLNGHGLGRKADSPDPRDHLYGMKMGLPASQPASIDLRKHLPPVWDQGQTNACGGFSAAALMSFLFPEVKDGFSALQIYYDARDLEGDTAMDSGIETRDLFNVLTKKGAELNSVWPFDPAHLTVPPPAASSSYKIESYSRLTGAADVINCLASGFPFVLGFMVPSSLDGAEIAANGIMQIPDLKTDQIVGGHDVLVVGYDSTFKHTPFFEASGVDPAKVDDTMLLVRNSWGQKWSPKFRGHFWMPLSYAINPSTGGDAWMARRSISSIVADHPMAMAAPAAPAPKPAPSPAQYSAGFMACRTALDATSYGSWVSDAKLKPISDAVTRAVVQA